MKFKATRFTLTQAVENLVCQVQEYESDTFSASESEVDRDTAEAIAAWLIENYLFDSEGMPGDCIDGAVIGMGFDVVTESGDS
jgi:hypothetical protein